MSITENRYPGSTYFFSRMLMIFVLLFPVMGQGEVGATRYVVNKGSMGIVRVLDESSIAVKLKIEFGEESLSPKMDYRRLPKAKEFPFTLAKTSYSIALDGDVNVFDRNGTILTLRSVGSEVQMSFWCENDGGMWFRPTMTLDVPKAKLIRPIEPIKGYGDIAAFAGIGASDDFRTLTSAFEEKKADPNRSDYEFRRLVTDGRLTKSGTVVVRLTESFFEPGCYDGNRAFNSRLALEMAGSRFGIWCCGP